MTHIKHLSGKVEWYTPPNILAFARRCLGVERFTFDPASSEAANASVDAEAYHTMADPLEAPWRHRGGAIWMNPPYARGLIDKFADRLLAEVQAHPTLQAAVLTNAATASGWWKRLARRADAIVSFGSRLAFIDGDTGKPAHGNAMGQTLFLFRPQHVPPAPKRLYVVELEDL